MFCKVCGAELRPDVGFCVKCGEKIPKKKEVEVPAQEEVVEQTAQPTQQEETVEQSAQQAQNIQQSAPIYNVSKEASSSAKTWLVIGLVCNLVNQVPGFNGLLFIPTMICTIISMNKLVNFLSGIEDEQAQKLFRGTKSLRLNYIISNIIVAIIVAVLLVSIGSIDEVAENTNQESIAEIFATCSILALVLFMIYYYGVLIWALVHWSKLNSYVSQINNSK